MNTQTEGNSTKNLSLTSQQLSSVVLNGNKHTEVSGRGIGKSTDIAWRLKELQRSMPGAASGLSGSTFAELLTITLAPVLGQLAKIGIHRDSHYVIGRLNPAWPVPDDAPPDFSRAIHFKTGHMTNFYSQDREDRGRSIVAIIGDEMLKQDKGRFENGPVASLRGSRKKWGKHPLYRSIDLKTSMPVGASGQWLLDNSNYYAKDGYDLWGYWNKLVRLQIQWIDCKTKADSRELVKEIAEAQSKIHFYRTKVKTSEGEETHLFTCGNVFSNLQNIGIDYVMDLRRLMSDIGFRIEIGNERIQVAEHGFYKINDDKHLYDRYDYSYIDSLEYDFDKLKVVDCRRDGDVDRSKPLDLSIDYGAHIMALVVGQPAGDLEYRWLKDFYVKYPDGLEQVINNFCDYYHYHPKKEVFHWYDFTAIGKNLKYAEETTRLLIKRGWKVHKRYIGVTPGYMERFELCEAILKNELGNIVDSRFPVMQFNKVNFKNALLAMNLADVKQGRNGFEKNKDTERSKVIPREQATDFTDAVDTIIWGRYAMKWKTNKAFVALRSM